MTALTEGLREAAERVHAISLTCWPNQVYCVRDSQGKAMAEPNDEMVREYERLGWKHAGFTRGYDALMNRWNYVKDLRSSRTPASCSLRMRRTRVVTSRSRGTAAWRFDA